MKLQNKQLRSTTASELFFFSSRQCSRWRQLFSLFKPLSTLRQYRSVVSFLNFHFIIYYFKGKKNPSASDCPSLVKPRELCTRLVCLRIVESKGKQKSFDSRSRSLLKRFQKDWIEKAKHQVRAYCKADANGRGERRWMEGARVELDKEWSLSHAAVTN